MGVTISNGLESVFIKRNASQETTFAQVVPTIGGVTHASGVHIGIRSGSGTLCRGNLVIDRVTAQEAKDLMFFIADKLRFGTKACTIIADTADLYYGVGVAISSVFLPLEGDLKNYIFRVGAFDKYEVRLPFEFWILTDSGFATRR